MRKDSKKNIISDKKLENNPYRNSQSEAYRKMKEKMQNENSEASSSSDTISKNKKKNKKFKVFFTPKKYVDQGDKLDNSTTVNYVESKNNKNSKDKIESTESVRFGKTELNKRGVIEERKAKQKRLSSKSRKITALVFVAVGLFSIVLVGLIYRNTQIVRLKYDINELNKELLNLQNEKEVLEVRMESNNRSDVIEKRAREQLGMDYPKENKITYIKVN